MTKKSLNSTMAADMATLAQDLESVGLTPSDLRRSSEESLNEPRALSRAASARIMSKKFIQRDKQKKKLVQVRRIFKFLSRLHPFIPPYV